MGKVISVRINDNLKKTIERTQKETNRDQSEVLRSLIRDGGVYKALKKYAKGKISIGRAAYLANMGLSNFIDLITDLGIPSKISEQDILEGYKHLKNL